MRPGPNEIIVSSASMMCLSVTPARVTWFWNYNILTSNIGMGRRKWRVKVHVKTIYKFLTEDRNPRTLLILPSLLH